MNEVIKALYWLSMLLMAGLLALFLFLCAIWVGLGIMSGFILLFVALFGR